MAGIGFVLRDLDRRETLLGSITSVGHGAVVAAGPWIFTVLSIALIHRGTANVLDAEISYNFRGLVIYAFALSLLATAPIVNVAIRQVADDIYLGEFQNVRPRYLATLLGCFVVSGVAALIVHLGFFHLSPVDFVVQVVSTMIIGLIWPTLAFCGAVKDYRGITLGFGVGLIASIVGTIWAATHGYSAAIMMLAFVGGLALVFFWLAGRVLASFPHPVFGLGRHLLNLGQGMLQYWVLALASLAAIAAIWIDKWVMWFSSAGVALQNGLVSSPIYDGAMFVAYLVIIPALGLFVTSIETHFFEDFRLLLDSIQGRATLSRIEQVAERLGQRTFRMIYRVMTTQGILCIVAIVASPIIAPWLGLQYEQLGIMRLGIIGAFFQFMFLTCTAILLFFDRHIRFFVLQAMFLTLQLSLTMIAIRWGPEYYGYGHLIACAVSAFASVVVLERTMGNAVYLTFAAAMRQPDKPRGKGSPKKPEITIAPAPELEQEPLPELPADLSRPLLRP